MKIEIIVEMKIEMKVEEEVSLEGHMEAGGANTDEQEEAVDYVEPAGWKV